MIGSESTICMTAASAKSTLPKYQTMYSRMSTIAMTRRMASWRRKADCVCFWIDQKRVSTSVYTATSRLSRSPSSVCISLTTRSSAMPALQRSESTAKYVRRYVEASGREGGVDASSTCCQTSPSRLRPRASQDLLDRRRRAQPAARPALASYTP